MHELVYIHTYLCVCLKQQLNRGHEFERVQVGHMGGVRGRKWEEKMYSRISEH